MKAGLRRGSARDTHQADTTTTISLGGASKNKRTGRQVPRIWTAAHHTAQEQDETPLDMLGNYLLQPPSFPDVNALEQEATPLAERQLAMNSRA